VGNTDKLLTKKHELKRRYLELIEDAYNFKQLDDALSDFAEFKATKVLYKINKLKFVVTEKASMA
jgi:hypothetical protein